MIENVQKGALAAILGSKYCNYQNALKSTKLDTLYQRRVKICKKFINKNMESQYPLLQKSKKSYNTRKSTKKVKEFQCRTQAFFKSSLPFLARLHNSNEK